MIAELTAALVEEPGVVLAVLFGSQAKGGADRDSDVDVLVELEAPGDDEVIALHRRLVERLGKEVDISTTRSAAHSQRFWENAIRDGIVLVDREDGWPSIVESPEAARVAKQVPLEELASGEREAVDYMLVRDQFDSEIAEQQRREREGS